MHILMLQTLKPASLLDLNPSDEVYLFGEGAVATIISRCREMSDMGQKRDFLQQQQQRQVLWREAAFLELLRRRYICFLLRCIQDAAGVLSF